MDSPDSDDVNGDGGEGASSGKPTGRGKRLPKRLKGRPPRASALLADATRRVKETTLPRLSQATGSARRWSTLDPDVKQRVIAEMLTAAAISAGKRMKDHGHLGIKLVGLGVVAAAPGVAEHAARRVGKRSAEANEKGQHAETERAGQQEFTPSSAVLDPAVLSDFADALGVRQSPDPEDLYREGPDALEPLYPLPEGLASLPWESLSRRSRFFVLVAAWARREADGIEQMKSFRVPQAEAIFQECLISAQHMRTPELVARSCEDLGNLAVASGDEAGARKWRAEAERALAR